MQYQFFFRYSHPYCIHTFFLTFLETGIRSLFLIVIVFFLFFLYKNRMSPSCTIIIFIFIFIFIFFFFFFFLLFYLYPDRQEKCGYKMSRNLEGISKLVCAYIIGWSTYIYIYICIQHSFKIISKARKIVEKDVKRYRFSYLKFIPSVYLSKSIIYSLFLNSLAELIIIIQPIYSPVHSQMHFVERK